ncbi:TOBE domain-containing protein [Permianibacter sp. IMCC34836]|uniref:TOBE domain-containing protein n=1 Tax=Permianibacter fluminis TaxID=2738515 RepID=UPI0015549C72|nr:TOBE domain-containing protein [Permianibacter fluminis]NQD36710.1 TOBE domain-containing protein [Permianibacter fluminis]
MNELPGQLLALEQEHGVLLADVAVDGAPFTALLLHAGAQPQWPLGAAVRLSFKETEIALAKNLRGELSFRNRHPATVTGIGHGKLLTAVQLQFGPHALTSVITSGSARRLQLQVGDQVEWLVKANEMQIELLATTSP